MIKNLTFEIFMEFCWNTNNYLLLIRHLKAREEMEHQQMMPMMLVSLLLVSHYYHQSEASTSGLLTIGMVTLMSNESNISLSVKG